MQLSFEITMILERKHPLEREQHVANGIIIQEGNTTLKEKIQVSKTIRKMKAPETNIAPYTCREKGSPSLQGNSSSEVENLLKWKTIHMSRIEHERSISPMFCLG